MNTTNWNNIPNDSSVKWKNVIDPTEIETLIVERNIKHLSQAEGLMSTTKTMKIIIGSDKYTLDVDAILSSNFTPSSNLLTPPHERYFQNLQRKNNIQPKGAPNTINIDDVNEGFEKWEEKTSTSPSNRHIGHYKSLLARNGHNKKESK